MNKIKGGANMHWKMARWASSPCPSDSGLGEQVKACLSAPQQELSRVGLLPGLWAGLAPCLLPAALASQSSVTLA